MRIRLKLLIEIPNKTYRMIKNNKYDYGDMNIIIQNVTQLNNIRERIKLEKLETELINKE